MTGPMTEVRVEITLTEQVTHHLTTTVQVPEAVADDPDALRDHLADDEDLWLDDLDPATDCASVDERDVTRVRILTPSH